MEMTCEEQWKYACESRFPDTKYIWKDELFAMNPCTTYESLYEDCQLSEQKFITQKTKLKMIMNSGDVKKNKEMKSFCYPVGVSSKYAVVINSYRQHQNNTSSPKIGQVYYIAVNDDVITKHDDPNRPDRWTPLWKTDPLHNVSGDVHLARVFDKYLLLIKDKFAYQNGAFVDQKCLFYYEILPTKLRLICEVPLSEVPTTMIAYEDVILLGYDKNENSKGLYFLHNTENWKTIHKIYNDPISSLNITREPVNGSYKHLLFCGLSDNHGTVIGLDLVDLAIERFSNIHQGNGLSWRRSFWNQDDKVKHQTIRNLKCIANTNISDFEFVIFSDDTGKFCRATADNKIPCIDALIPDIGTVIGADLTTNIVVLHHCTNDIVFMHHTSGNKIFYKIDLSKKFPHIYEAKTSFIYDSVKAFWGRFVVLLPDGNIIFIVLD